MMYFIQNSLLYDKKSLIFPLISIIYHIFA
nr:MAG TPA: hypothetical protein [Caudoviricetes sp.]